MKKFLLFSALLLCTIGLFAQPANDLCSGALPVTVGSNTCGPTVTGDNTGATDSGENGYACTSSYSGGDIWYTFTVPAAALGLEITYLSGAWSSMLISVTSGICGSLTEEFCTTQFGAGTSTITGLTPGSTYFLRLADFGNNDIGTVDFCMTGITCPEPTGLSGTDITSMGATAFWDDGGAMSWIVEYGLDGFTPGTGTLVASADTFEMIGGLMAATDYDVYVAAVCGDTSSQDGPYSFTTLCNVFSPPYTTDFATFLPTCWEEASTGDPSTGPMSFGAGDWTGDGFGNVGTTGSARVELWNTGTSDWIVGPEIDLGAGGFQADFDIALTIWNTTDPGTLGSDDEVQFLITDDGGATWDTLMVWNSSSVISNTGENVVVDISSYTGTVQMAFWGYEGVVDDIEDNNFYVDNFFVRTPPTCIEVSNWGTTNITQTTATATWSSDTPTNTWKIEYDTAGFAEGSGMMALATDTFFNLTGLTANTDYDFYITEICGPGDSSFTIGPASFMTLANAPQRCAELISPANGATGVRPVDVPISVSFDPNDNVTGYYFMFGTDPGTLDTLFEAAVSTDTITSAPDAPNYGTTYYWQIIPFNSGGAASGCDIWSFTTVAIQDPPNSSAATCGTGSFGVATTESFAATLPIGWSGDIATGTGVGLWHPRTGTTPSGGAGQTGPSAAHDGTHYLYYESSAGADTASVISAPIDLTSNTDGAEIEFYVHMNGSGMGNMVIEAASTDTAGTTWTMLGTLVGPHQEVGADPWKLARYDITAFNGDTVYIRFTAELFDMPPTFLGDMAIDAFSLRTCQGCPAPSDGFVTNITSMGATLDWTENGTASSWNIEIGPAGFTPGSGTFSMSTGMKPFTWSGGMEATEYEFYVASDCGGGMISDTVGPFAFTTVCAPKVADYCQGFENGFPPTNTSLAGGMYDCWSNVNTADPDWSMDDGPTGSTNTGPTGPNSGSWYVYLETSSGAAGESDTLKGPMVDVSALTMPRLTFFYHMYGADIGTLSWQISDDMGATWAEINSLTGQQQTTNADPWLKIEEDLSTYGDTLMLRFVGSKGGSSFNGDIALDDICVEETPGCETPTALVANNVTDMSADLDWTPGAVETDWIVSYGPAPTTAGSGTLVATTIDSLDLTGLAGDTDYDVHVQAVCGSDTSAWVSAAFTTQPTPPVNDECDDAIGLTVNPDLACGTVTAGTTVGATASPQPDDVTGTPNTDVWYTFVATSTNHQIVIDNVVNQGGGTSTSTDMGMGVYDGSGGCLGLVFFDDSDPNTLNLTGMTIGRTYVVRVYGWSSSIQYNNFDICIGTPPPPPANDSCSMAAVLTLSTPGICDNAVSGTTVSATPDADGCNTTNPGVWYTFTTTDTAMYHIKATETVDYGSSTTYTTVYSGTCGSLTRLGTTCFSSTGVNIPLSATTTYYVNVRSTSTSAGVDFDLCAFRIPDRPANDSCAGAFTLMESDFTCNNAVSGYTANATPSVSADGTCSTSGRDVWYTFTPMSTAEYNFSVTETYDLSSNSTYVAIYEGGCGSLTQVGTGCFSSSATVMLTASTTYWVTVRSSSSSAGTGTFFDLCAYTCAPIVPDYITDFGSFHSPCWSDIDAAGSPDWIGDDFGNVVGGPNGRAARINIYTTQNDTLLSPEFDLSAAGGYELKFDFASTDFGDQIASPWGAGDFIDLVVSDDGGSTWTSLMTWTDANKPSNTGDNISFDISAYAGSGSVIFGFAAIGVNAGSEDVDVFVDNFEITYNAPCAPFLFIGGTPATGVFRAVDIVSDALIESPNVVDFEGGTSVELNNDFEVELGAEFTVEMVECP